jgi:hypothetical protein
MTKFRTWFHSVLRGSRSRGDRFDVRVISTPVELFDASKMPFELRFLFDRLPESAEKVRSLLERGYGIGIRTTRRTSPVVLQAVDRIAETTQGEVAEPWLTKLIFEEEIPLFTEDELAEQNERGINLYTEAHLILSERFTMVHVVLADLEAHGIEDADMEAVSQMNRALEPLSAAFLHHRIHADRRVLNVRFIGTLAKALIIIGPLAHLLEIWVRGIGQLFAALADDVSREIGQLVTLKGSGYTARQLWRRTQVFIPILIIDFYLALQVNGLLERGSAFTAGLVFGIVAVSFPLVELLRSFVLTRSAYADLLKNGKLPKGPRPALSSLAFREIVRNPLRAGIAIGVIAGPLIAGALFAAMTPLAHNGWFLAIVAMLEIIIGLAFAWNVLLLDRVLFIAKIRRRMKGG